MSISPPFSIVVEIAADGAVLSLQGECDMAAVPAIADAVEALETRWVVVDLSGLTFLDSSGLGALLRAKSCLEQRGGTLRISGAAGSVLKVLEITGVYDDLRSA